MLITSLETHSNPVRNALRTAVVDETYYQMKRTTMAGARGNSSNDGFAKRQAELAARKKDDSKL